MKKIVRIVFALCLSAALVFPPSAQAAAEEAKHPKNVILMIGDGMGYSHFWAAQLYSSRVLKKDLRMLGAMNAGHTAYVVNDTADSTVTESAAAAGQMATGQRMTALTISTAADGKTPVKTVLEMAKEKGLSTGLVTTSGITDATPAAFSAHSASRYDEASIAEQQIKLGVDVLFGGRRQNFLPKEKGGKREDGRDMIEEAKKAGYHVTQNFAEFSQETTAARLLGLYNMNNLTFTIDRADTTEPTLAQMAEKALSVLSKNEKGFFAVIEGGRIDHAAHNNDIAATIHEVIAFDEAVGVALDFAAKNPDTMVLVTADHETGGLALIGCGKEGKEYIGLNPEAISKFKASFYKMFEGTRKDPKPETIKETLKKYSSIELTDAEAKIVAEDQIKKLDPFNYHYTVTHSLAFVLRPYLRAGWGSQTHTGSPLFLFGTGPGSESIRGMMHNTGVFAVIKNALDLK